MNVVRAALPLLFLATVAFANVIANGQPDFTVSEHPDGRVIQIGFSITNTGPGIITTGKVSSALAAVGGDTTYDALDLIGDTGACDNLRILVGVANSCALQVGLTVLDHDPFDLLNPPVDVGKWFVSITVPWVDATGAAGVPATAGVNVKVADDTSVPEPASAWLLVGGAAVLACRRRLRT